MAFGSQVCYSPGRGRCTPCRSCPSVTEVPTLPAFNGSGAPQSFMLQAPPTGQLWTSVVGLITAVDGLAYVQDLGRFGPVNAVSMLNDDTTQDLGVRLGAGRSGRSASATQPSSDSPPGPPAIGFWLDRRPEPPVVVV